MAEKTENENIAEQCCKGGSASGHVDTAVDVVDRKIGKYSCPVNGSSMPTQAQAPSTVSPFGSLR